LRISTYILSLCTGALDNLPVETPDGKFLLMQLAQISQKNPTMYIVDMTTTPQVIEFR
jgi:hypothetical protein